MAAPKITTGTQSKKENETGGTQLSLLQEINPFWQSTLFSDVYLRNDVPNRYREVWEHEEAGPFYEFCEQFRNLCEELRGEKFESWSEKSTINRFIKPILKLLGWANNCSPNQEPWVEDESLTIKKPGETKTYKPDFIIVNNPKQLKYIEDKDGDAKLQEARTSSIISIEAKYWGRIDESKYSKREDKDRADKKAMNDATRALDFDEQCLKYVDILHHDYGILTDGRTWRLYHRELSSGSFKRCYQFNLGKLAKHVLAGLDKNAADYRLFVENAKYFYHLFSKAALHNDDGDRRFVDNLIADSRKYSDKIEEDLKLRFVSAMAIACNGFRRALGKSFSDKNLDLIRSVAESHIFTILFIRYCESKNILPLRQNPEYRKTSLSNIIDKLDFFDPEKEADDLNTPTLLRRFKENFIYKPSGTDLYDTLVQLVGILQDGLQHPAAKFSIPGFNETVFTEEELTFAKQHKLENREMVRLLFELAYIEGDKPGSFQQIAYSFFAPRQLGSIYESFLEFRLERAEADMAFIKRQWLSAEIDSQKIKKLNVPTVKKGILFFSPNNAERKATSSYYTPDNVVQLILTYSLEPILAKATSAEVLATRICDPSMGSGHFLSGALDYLSRRYLELLEHETHGDLDIGLVEAKRAVLQRCIHGVDINPRAVKLAKMSLWLESATSNQPLEPLDDKLKCADSLTSDWNALFPEVLDSGGFTSVIGNPPYLGEKGNKDVFRPLRTDSVFCAKYYERKMDLFYFFFSLGISLLKENGTLGFITTNYWVTADGASKLRKHFTSAGSIIQYIDFRDTVIFKSAQGQCNSATVFRRNASWTQTNCQISRATKQFSSEFATIGQISLANIDHFETQTLPLATVAPANNVWTFGSHSTSSSKISTTNATAEISYEPIGKDAICRSVETGCDIVTDKIIAAAIEKKLLSNRQGVMIDSRGNKVGYKKGDGIFVIDKSDVSRIGVEGKFLVNFYKNSQIGFYCIVDAPSKRLIYVDSQTKMTKNDKLLRHFEYYRPLLAAREQANNEDSNFYWIRGSKRNKIYGKTTIVCPYRSTVPKFALSNSEVYGAGDIYHFFDFCGLSGDVMLAYLNSEFVQRWLLKYGKRKGKMFELYQTPLSQLPKPSFLQKAAIEISARVEQLYAEIAKVRKGSDSSRSFKESMDQLATARLERVLGQKRILPAPLSNVDGVLLQIDKIIFDAVKKHADHLYNAVSNHNAA